MWCGSLSRAAVGQLICPTPGVVAVRVQCLLSCGHWGLPCACPSHHNCPKHRLVTLCSMSAAVSSVLLQEVCYHSALSVAGICMLGSRTYNLIAGW